MAPAQHRERVSASKAVAVQVAASSADLGVLGSLVDQAHAAASQAGAKVVFAPSAGSSVKALTTLLSLKEPALVQVARAVEAGSVSAELAKGSDLLVYLSADPVKGPATYVPALAADAAGHTNGVAAAHQLASSAWQVSLSTGRPVVVASATEPNVLTRILAGEVVGTLYDGAAAQAAAAAADASAAAADASTAAAVASAAATSECRATAQRARAASRRLQALPSSERVAMLQRVADALLAHQDQILEENAKDVAAATGKVADALLQRLVLKPAKISQLADGIRAIAKQDEPIGQLLHQLEIAEGLVLDKTTAPIGVLLIIFEARPDALPQIASLAIRSGNGLLLKGGKEATRSNAILHRIIVEAVGELGPDLISLVTTREEINDLLELDDVIDLVIPRGGNALVSYIQRNTRIPVLGHADGICHAYVDAAADLDMACRLVVDAKVDYPAACNAVEKVLVHSSWLSKPTSGQGSGVQRLLAALRDAGVTVHGGVRSSQELGLPLAPSQRHEYSSMDVTLELVDTMDQAVDHVHANGSSHTELIITEDLEAARRFLASVDAACVFHNASTRFSDGFRFGLGAEVGISTSRIHARGPVGVEGLLTTKWVLRGHGQVVAKDKGVQYTHRRLDVRK